MILLILFLIFFVLAAILYMMDTVQTFGRKKIINYNQLPNEIKVILVLGAGINDDGTPCEMLIDRLITAVKIYQKIVDSKILLSGDHGTYAHNEVGIMKKYIMKRNENIDERNIFLDHAGFSTYESIYRAKEIFKADKIIIVTNEYHLPRALYIAEKMGIEACGIASDSRGYEEIDIYENRELLAQVKDYMYVNIFKPKPKYLGEKVPINESDGRITDDNM